jgi:hypothetical protein
VFAACKFSFQTISKSINVLILILFYHKLVWILAIRYSLVKQGPCATIHISLKTGTIYGIYHLLPIDTINLPILQITEKYEMP